LWTTLLTDPVSGWIHRGAQQRSCTQALTQEDAIEIMMNMSRLLDVLLDKDAG